MATIKDVAKLAGVSTATVSNVINKTRYVSPELVAKVSRAMKELNYRPNVVARSLKGKESSTIGFIVPDITIPFFPEILKGMEETANKHGYNVMLCNTNEDITREISSLQMLREKLVDGVVLSSVRGSLRDREHVIALIEDGFPTVVIDRSLKDTIVNSITVDHVTAAYKATKHLLDLGHRRVAAITGDLELILNQDRLRGYRNALEEYGIQHDYNLVVEGDFTTEKGYECMKKLLKRINPPTAVFAFNDLMAIGAMSAVRSEGLNIPDDVSIVGFDDISISKFLHPPLTTVSQPMQRMGAEAFELLYGLIQKQRDIRQPVHKILPAELVVRESTAPPPAAASSIRTK